MMTRFTRVKKQAAAVMALVMLLGCLNLFPGAPVPRAAAADAGWPAEVLKGDRMPFRPTDSLVTTQNPPDFSWPHISGADSYHLRVSRDSAMTAVVHENPDVKDNFFNFQAPFDSGIWYWQVRYRTGAGWSDWSTARKFRIAEDNVPFPVPSVEELIGNVDTAHPRIWTNPDDLTAFRNLKLSGNSKTVYDRIRAAVDSNLSKPIPTEPTFPYMDGSVPTNSPEFVAAQGVLRGYVDSALARMMETAFVYLLTGETAIGENAKAQLLNVASWDPFGSTKFEIQDQVHRAIAYRSAMVYDWLHPLLSDSDKAEVQEMTKTRTNTLVQKFIVNQPINWHPYDSHGWTIFGYIGLIATAMMHDMPEAEGWFKATVPAYINMLPPWGGEDGSWSQGTGYWQWSSGSNKELMDVLLSAGVINLYDKAFSRNEGLYPLYMFPHGSPTGVFGNDSHYTPGLPSIGLLNRLSQMNRDGRLKWEAEAIGSASLSGLTDYFYGDPDLESRPPTDLAKGKWFPVTGLAAMHSDLWDTDRTSLYFRSSPYGSYSHSNADQNSFIIHAFGEPLAVKAGHYDYYDSVHHAGFSKQTFSANAITYDGRKGQQTNSIDADGSILGFVTHADFDAVSGDATVAYSGGLNKAVRHILYVRPSMYVVIDDLAAAAAGGSEFEWNLHTDEQLAFHEDGKGATVAKGDAELEVRFHGAQADSLRTTLENRYLNAVGVEVAPGGSFAGTKQLHAAFVTPKTSAAKLVATMEPHKRGTAPQNVASEDFGSYVRLSFEDGTKVYVRTANGGPVDTGADGIVFDGAAAAVKGDSVLLVDGVSLTKDGVTVVQSDKRATVAIGGKLLSVSAQADAVVQLIAPAVTTVRDSDSEEVIPAGGDIAEAMNARGVHWTAAGNTVTMQVEKGQKNFKLNDAPAPGQLPDVTLQTEIDGVQGQVTLKASRDIEGVSVAWGNLTNASGFYKVLEAPEGFTFLKHGRIASGLLEANAPILLKGATGVLKLESVGSGAPVETVVHLDHEQVKTTWNMEWQEAEIFTQWGGKKPTIYTTRPFLSNGAGVSDWDQTGQWMKWKLNVPKAGTYDLVLKYVGGWLPEGGDRVDITRFVQLGSELNYFHAAPTTDFGAVHENWRVVRVKLGGQLSAGPVDLTMWHQRAGMNLDWIGLVEVKDDVVRPTVPGKVTLESQTGDSATVSWAASTDNEAVKEYVVYVDGVRKMTVTDTSATITGLTTGGSYIVSVRAVDTSGNLSNVQPQESQLTVSLADEVPPQWGDSVLRAELLFANAVRLAWDPATDVGKIAEYRVYRLGGAEPELVGSSGAASYDVTGLAPGGTYSFRVEAVDEYGNVSTGGPEMTVTLPQAAATKAVYEGFDQWADGEVVSGNNWTVQLRNDVNAVRIVPLEDLGGKGLQSIDNWVDPADAYATGPRVWREMAPFGVGGKVTVETRVKFSPVNHPSGNFTIDLAGNGAAFAGFVGLSDGGLGFQRVENGAVRTPRLTQFGMYAQPAEEWVTIRFDIDFAAKKYDLTVQADSLRGYAGSEAGAIVDTAAGTVSAKDVPFLNGASNGLEMFRMITQRFTGKFTYDYVAMYQPGQMDLTPPATTDDAPVGGMANTDVTVNLTATDAGSGVAATRYTVNGGEPQTGNAVALTQEGTHTIVYWSVDKAGNREAPHTLTVTLDKTEPATEASLSPEAPEGNAEWYRSPVTLSLSAGDALSGVSRTEYRVNGGDWIAYDGSIPAFGEGVHAVDYRSSDAAGNEEEFKTVRIAVDTTAPGLTVALDKTSIWPPNGKMVDIRATLASNDEASGIASVILTSITSNEPGGEDDIEAAIGTAADSFRLRAEREGGGDGRVYTVTYMVTDNAGNRSTAAATVTVPHNK